MSGDGRIATRRRATWLKTASAAALGTALCIALTACAGPPTDSGVRGTVTIGPTSPVQRAGDSGVAPYAATITVRSSDGSVAAQVRSSGAGTFTVDLAPGAYTLVPQNGDPVPRAQPLAVVVQAHVFTDVAITYDSGIR